MDSCFGNVKIWLLPYLIVIVYNTIIINRFNTAITTIKILLLINFYFILFYNYLISYFLNELQKPDPESSLAYTLRFFLILYCSLLLNFFLISQRKSIRIRCVFVPNWEPIGLQLLFSGREKGKKGQSRIAEGHLQLHATLFRNGGMQLA